ncbi:MAG: hypothetical protein QG602_4170, partial [Verrucomicrobiota bacterium]|nr:hypothetical protein [Verrucomicrobiota bacterium]
NCPGRSRSNSTVRPVGRTAMPRERGNTWQNPMSSVSRVTRTVTRPVKSKPVTEADSL